jgi:hypothetical protein
MKYGKTSMRNSPPPKPKLADIKDPKKLQSPMSPSSNAENWKNASITEKELQV